MPGPRLESSPFVLKGDLLPAEISRLSMNEVNHTLYIGKILIIVFDSSVIEHREWYLKPPSFFPPYEAFQ